MWATNIHPERLAPLPYPIQPGTHVRVPRLFGTHLVPCSGFVDATGWRVVLTGVGAG